jgi:hypothetical protein
LPGTSTASPSHQDTLFLSNERKYRVRFCVGGELDSSSAGVFFLVDSPAAIPYHRCMSSGRTFSTFFFFSFGTRGGEAASLL